MQYQDLENEMLGFIDLVENADSYESSYSESLSWGEKNVIKLFLFLCASANLADAQDLDYQLPHYALMQHVMAQDTVVQDWQRKIMKKKVESGCLSPENTIRYIRKLKSSQLLLRKSACNAVFREKMQKLIWSNTIPSKWIGKEIIFRDLELLPLNFEFVNSEDFSLPILKRHFQKWFNYF